MPTTDSVSTASTDPLGDEIATLCAHINAATYRLLCLLKTYDEEGRWEGFRTCAHWLSWRTGISLGPARQKVRVARCLPNLYPAEDGGYEIRGRLSPEVGSLLLKALEAAERKLFHQQREAGTEHETTAEQRRADALGLWLEEQVQPRGPARGALVRGGGAGDAARPGGRSAGRSGHGGGWARFT